MRVMVYQGFTGTDVQMVAVYVDLDDPTAVHVMHKDRPSGTWGPQVRLEGQPYPTGDGGDDGN